MHHGSPSTCSRHIPCHAADSASEACQQLQAMPPVAVEGHITPLTHIAPHSPPHLHREVHGCPLAQPPVIHVTTSRHWWDAVHSLSRLILGSNTNVTNVQVGRHNELATYGVVLCTCGVLGEQAGVSVACELLVAANTGHIIVCSARCKHEVSVVVGQLHMGYQALAARQTHMACVQEVGGVMCQGLWLKQHLNPERSPWQCNTAIQMCALLLLTW